MTNIRDRMLRDGSPSSITCKLDFGDRIIHKKHSHLIHLAVQKSDT